MSIGYSNDLYNALFDYGLNPGHHIVDVACGTGAASRPLIENGFRVTGIDASASNLAKARERLPAALWVEGSPEALPFESGTFDAAIGAQGFHRVDRVKAIAELVRVLKPGGIVGIWWRVPASDDPVKNLSDRVAREMGVDPPQSGLTGGFKEFYGSGLVNPQLRVVPWHATVPLETYFESERVRGSVASAFGSRTNQYVERLESRLHEILGDRPAYVPLGFIQYLYVART